MAQILEGYSKTAGHYPMKAWWMQSPPPPFGESPRSLPRKEDVYEMEMTAWRLARPLIQWRRH